MALTEQKILSSVTHNVTANTVDVKWLNQILRDGEVISETPHRCAYHTEQKDQFTADLGIDAPKYLAMVGW